MWHTHIQRLANFSHYLKIWNENLSKTYLHNISQHTSVRVDDEEEQENGRFCQSLHASARGQSHAMTNVYWRNTPRSSCTGTRQKPIAKINTLKFCSIIHKRSIRLDVENQPTRRCHFYLFITRRHVRVCSFHIPIRTVIDHTNTSTYIKSNNLIWNLKIYNTAL